MEITVKEFEDYLGKTRVKEIKEHADKIEVILKEESALKEFNKTLKETRKGEEKDYYEVCLMANSTSTGIGGCFIWENSEKGQEYWSKLRDKTEHLLY